MEPKFLGPVSTGDSPELSRLFPMLSEVWVFWHVMQPLTSHSLAILGSETLFRIPSRMTKY